MPPAVPEPASVFIVDDDAAVRAGISLLVRSHGWQPYAYPSAGEFVRHYHRAQRGCLVLDIQLPEMTGLEVAELLSRLDVELPVILVTAYKEHALPGCICTADALGVLVKPFRDAELIGCIGQALKLVAH